jgi:glucose/arabinose dehydrogenase/cytochrome c553
VLKKILIGVFLLFMIIAGAVWYFIPTVNGPLLDMLLGRQIEVPAAETLKARLKVPDGYKVGIFARDVPNARMMRITETGDLVITSNRTGSVFLLYRDENGDGISDGRSLLLSGLREPHGVAFNEGYLYIAEETQIIRALYDAKNRILGSTEVIFTGMPSGGNHRTRTIGFDSAGKLYVTVGSSCNVCIEEEPYRAEMLQMNADGTNVRTYATGLRNSVGFDWNPKTQQLFATDNGRDLIGDDTPNCEVNLIEDGRDYGWPYAFDNRTPDPDYGDDNMDKVSASTPPIHGLGAHRAPLGLKFLTAENIPESHQDAALAALHGSWNSSKLVGYKVVSLHFDDKGGVTERDFLSGFELNENVIGRPVDIEQGPDGAIYISDDYAGVIYRVGFDAIPVGIPGEEVIIPPANPLANIEGTELATNKAAGELIFGVNGCGTCHVPGAAEGVQVKKFEGLKERYTLEEMQLLFLSPPGPMPSFENLSEAERRALAIYVLSSEDAINSSGRRNVDF